MLSPQTLCSLQVFSTKYKLWGMPTLLRSRELPIVDSICYTIAGFVLSSVFVYCQLLLSLCHIVSCLCDFIRLSKELVDDILRIASTKVSDDKNFDTNRNRKSYLSFLRSIGNGVCKVTFSKTSFLATNFNLGYPVRPAPLVRVSQ